MIELKLHGYSLTDLKILRKVLYYANEKCTDDCEKMSCSECVKYKCCRDMQQALVFLDKRIKFISENPKGSYIVK